MSEMILVVEDEQAIADNICFALRYEGFSITHFTEGQPALDWFGVHKAGCVVLDVGLPDINGFEVCKAIRQHSQVPILFLTARSEEVDRIVGFEIGADDYVCKPFSPRELVARIKAILKRINTQAEPSGLFEINDKACEIKYRDVQLDLTRYEYGVLSYLLNHPNQVFTREQLLLAVWREPLSSSDRVVDTHIKTLRAKLRVISANDDPLITHRGLGYSLKL
jgi:two-component system catabolic regulation response regulator CreB